jgi:MEDS: MEthanogen/methylotroph, DcmR Sensory domain
VAKDVPRHYAMSAWEKLLERPHSRGHYVQLYEADEQALSVNVGLYLWEGLRRGEGALVIATPDHTELFLRELDRLGAATSKLLQSRQLVVLDAAETMSLFMVAGQPDWHRFKRAVSEAMRQVLPAHDGAGLRAYGEMVGLLWKTRQFAAAIRLEQFWNKQLEESSFSLYCAYAIDVFGQEFQVANLDGVLCTHTHLVPAQPNGNLETAVNLAMDEILGANADALKVLIKANYRPSWAVMPSAEAMVLWLRKNLPGQADEILTRARHHYAQLPPADLLPAR